jgi:hypothetical protein
MIQTYRDNIEKVYLDSTKLDHKEGIAWYGIAREFCEEVAYRHNMPVWKVVLMLSALSPRNKWSRNKTDVLGVIKDGLDAKCSTFNANKEKACKIYHASFLSQGLDILGKGKKTRAFFYNIYNYNSNKVCVDSWACRVAQLGKDTPTVKQYRDLEEAYRLVATKYGLVPMDLQAITWVSFRRKTTTGAA